jgi:hypothetical protein
MRVVAPLFAAFREAARHLWNTASRNAGFGPGHDWDRRDALSRVATASFTALVLEPLGVGGQRLTNMWEHEPAPLTGFTVTPAAEAGTSTAINRALPPSPYRDHPIGSDCTRRDIPHRLGPGLPPRPPVPRHRLQETLPT